MKFIKEFHPFTELNNYLVSLIRKAAFPKSCSNLLKEPASLSSPKKIIICENTLQLSNHFLPILDQISSFYFSNILRKSSWQQQEVVLKECGLTLKTPFCTGYATTRRSGNQTSGANTLQHRSRKQTWWRLNQKPMSNTYGVQGKLFLNR